MPEKTKTPAPKTQSFDEMMASEKKKAQKLEALLRMYDGMTKQELQSRAGSDAELKRILGSAGGKKKISGSAGGKKSPTPTGEVTFLKEEMTIDPLKRK